MKLFVRLLLLVATLGMLTFGVVLRGRVEDAKCAPNRAKVDFSPACARRCVRKGIAPVLFARNHIYPVANPKALAPFAGDWVKVVGVFRHHRLVVRKVTKL